MRGYEDLQIFLHFWPHQASPRASVMQPQPDLSLVKLSMHDPSVPCVHQITGHLMIRSGVPINTKNEARKKKSNFME